MRALHVFLVWASQGLQEEHRVSALFCCPKAREPDGQSPGHGEAKMSNNPTPTINIDSDDYFTIPNYRESVDGFIKSDSKNGSVAISVDGSTSVQVTNIEQVDEIVRLLK